MGVVGTLIEAIHILFSWPVFGWMILGVLLGIVVGALPGIGAALGMAIVLPFTFPLDRISALVLLIGIYTGAMYGGSIAAILINTPGTGGAAATTFDGYPMTRKGLATTALSISATASAIGGGLSLLTLILISPLLIELVLLFGSPEYFLMAILGLSMITIVAKTSIVKGLVAGAFGMLLATIGIAPSTGESRYTFGLFALYDGLSFVAVLIGLFAISEMIKLAAEQSSIATNDLEMGGGITNGIKEVFYHPICTIKSGYIGMAIGAIPGAGASVANFIAYGEASRSSKNSDEFGTGCSEGVIASEASNSGTIGGSLIPTLSFGIPGSAATAVLLGGLIMHGLQPGPHLFKEELHITYSLFLAVLLGNIIILLTGILAITRMSYLTRINTNKIIPVVIVLAFLGGIALRTNWIDVITVLILGILGYYMVRNNYSIIAFVLGVILGPIAEENLLRSLQISGGSWNIFVTQPISFLLMILIVVILFGPFVKTALAKRS